MVKLSIIIPYFETYELTERLLKSLSIQTTREVEVIVIDDGCKEERLDIFDGYMGIKTIHNQYNIGVAKTRNKGIKLATGKYVAFIDCDDMITENYIDTLLDAIDKYDTDVINFNWYDMTEHKEYRKPHNYAPWKAIYKKETMPMFSEEYEYGHEDVIFQGEIDSGKYNIVYLDKLLYLYNSNREGSLYWKKIHKEGKNMVKVEVLEDFSLKAFDELKNIKRRNKSDECTKEMSEHLKGKLFLGDTFECTKEMADYLTGNNPIKKAVVKIIEVIPEEKEIKVEEVEATIEYTEEDIKPKATFKPKKNKKKK